MKSVILLVLAGLLIAGCAPNTTTGVNRQYEITMEIRDNLGPVTLEIPLQVDAMSTTDQAADQASDISPDVRFQLSEGAASGVMSGADAILKDVTNTLKNEIKERAIERVKESIPVTPAKPIEEEEKEDASDDNPIVGEIGKSETYDFSSFANGRQGWRIPKSGANYKTPLLFKFSSGFERVVVDLSSRIEDNNGFLVRPGTGKKEDPKEGSTFTSHGGMYVHAPYGDESTKLTLSEIKRQ